MTPTPFQVLQKSYDVWVEWVNKKMSENGCQSPIYPEELEAAVRDALARLASVDRKYREHQAAIEQRALSKGQKARLRAQLDAKHKRDREPLVLLLANLHYRMMRATIFGSLANPVHSTSALRAFRV